MPTDLHYPNITQYLIFILLMDAVMLSYLSQPCGSVPLPVGLQVAASICCLVNQTQQLNSL